MPRATSGPLPPCFAVVHPGLESVAADEITRDLGGEVRKTMRGLVVFRADSIDRSLLKLRTTEDVFLFAWGTDALTHRAADLKQIRKWTATEPDWRRLFELHHAVRPKSKGRPTYRFVSQMTGKHVYRRIDAQEAVMKGLPAGTITEAWRPAEENAWLEIWLMVHGPTAVCGVRLSDRTMRHREYKSEHTPASLRPTVAAAMARLAGAGPEQIVLDPMCGAGTILAEQLELARQRRAGVIYAWGGDLDPASVRAASVNLRQLGPGVLARWDAHRLPLAAASVDRIVCNLPFGKQLSSPEEIGPLYAGAVAECGRVLRPGGRAVLLVSDPIPLRQAARRAGWHFGRELRVFVLGQKATLAVWHKPEGAGPPPVVHEEPEDVADEDDELTEWPDEA